ncbi:hypothetical protein Tco_1287300, partial [Tanacetum coccineum]
MRKVAKIFDASKSLIPSTEGVNGDKDTDKSSSRTKPVAETQPAEVFVEISDSTHSLEAFISTEEVEHLPEADAIEKSVPNDESTSMSDEDDYSDKVLSPQDEVVADKIIDQVVKLNNTSSVE